MEHELYHHGILGQKWGVRRYQNEDGSLKPAGKKRYSDGWLKKINTANKTYNDDMRKAKLTYRNERRNVGTKVARENYKNAKEAATKKNLSTYKSTTYKEMAKPTLAYSLLGAAALGAGKYLESTGRGNDYVNNLLKGMGTGAIVGGLYGTAINAGAKYYVDHSKKF